MPSDKEVETLVFEARQTLASQGTTRQALASVLAKLQTLADDKSRWAKDNYPDPEEGERQARYLVREDPDHGFALYLNVMRPGKRIPPHNHTTWACIAAVSGVEHNTLFERIDSGTGAGPATLRQIGEIEVKPGQGMSLLPNDVHAVEIRGSDVIRHLHFYGKALETLSDRLTFDTTEGTAKPMKMSVQTKHRA
jgi:predicted metal-dependent enzyme (double-stranded beta helix superfamily)